AKRQLNTQDAVLVGGGGLLGLDVAGELDDAAELARGKLDLLVGAAVDVADRALAADHQGAAADLDVDRVELDAGEVGLDHGAPRLAAVVDVDAGRVAGRLTLGRVRPDVPEELVHLAPDQREIGERITLLLHWQKRSGRARAAQTSKTSPSAATLISPSNS